MSAGIDALNGSGTVDQLTSQGNVAITVGTTGGNGSFAGVIQNSLGGTTKVVKVGTGVQALTGINAYGGGTSILGGTLQVFTLQSGGVNDSLGNGSANNGASGLLISGGGTLQYIGSGDTTDRLFTLGDGGGTLRASGSGAINFNNTGAIGFSAVGPVTLTLLGSNAGANNLAAALDDNGGNPTSLFERSRFLAALGQQRLQRRHHRRPGNLGGGQ